MRLRHSAVAVCCMIAVARSAQPAPLFRVVETALQFSEDTSINPWSIAGSSPGCQAVLVPPAGSRYSGNMTLPLFYDGDAADGSWELAFRFTPDVAGSWGWTLQCAPFKLLPGQPSAGTVTVASAPGADGTGGVVGGRANPQLYERENGSRWTPVGYEMDWLWAMGMNGTGAAETAPVDDALRVLGSYGFNHFLVSLYANHSAWSGSLPHTTAGHVWWAESTRNSPWSTRAGGGGIDYSHLNLRFLRQWDGVLDAADRHGLVIHLMMYVGNKNVDWPPRLGPDDNIYWRNILARYAAHPAVIIDVSKEAASYGIGSDYVLDRLRLIHKHNSHHRLVTAHSGLDWSGRCPGCNLTMVSLQVHTDNHTDGTWYRSLRSSMETNPTVPVANIEFMYAAGVQRLCNGSAGHDCAAATSTGCGDDPSKIQKGHCADLDTMRSAMWGMYMALGSSAWYDCDTAWDFIALPPADHSAALPSYRWMTHLAKYWDRVDRSALVPCGPVPLKVHKAVQWHCLRSKAHDEAVIYVWDTTGFSYTPGAEEIASGVSSNGGGADQVQGVWYDPLTGKNQSFTVPAAKTLNFATPAGFHRDAVLHLTHLA